MKDSIINYFKSTFSEMEPGLVKTVLGAMTWGKISNVDQALDEMNRETEIGVAFYNLLEASYSCPRF